MKPSRFFLMWGSRLVLALIFLGAAYLLYSVGVGLAGCTRPKSTSPLLSEVKERNTDVEQAIILSTEVSDRIARHGELPERSPLGMGWLSESQASNGPTMAQLTETLAIEIGSSEALGTIRTLRENQTEMQGLVAQTRSNDPAVANSAKVKLEALNAENRALELKTKEILENEGMSFSEQEIHSLCVSPNAEDTLALISAFGSIKKISQKMEERLRKFPSPVQAQRYYGAYCVLLMALDKIQKEGMRRIEEDHIPKARDIEMETKAAMQDAQTLLAQSGLESGPSGAESRALRNNIATCQTTIKISLRTQDKLRQNLAIIDKANQKLQSSIAAAKNSHLTVMLQKEIVALEETHLQEISHLQSLTIPELVAVNFADPEHPEVSGPNGREIEAAATY